MIIVGEQKRTLETNNATIFIVFFLFEKYLLLSPCGSRRGIKYDRVHFRIKFKPFVYCPIVNPSAVVFDYYILKIDPSLWRSTVIKRVVIGMYILCIFRKKAGGEGNFVV